MVVGRITDRSESRGLQVQRRVSGHMRSLGSAYSDIQSFVSFGVELLLCPEGFWNLQRVVLQRKVRIVFCVFFDSRLTSQLQIVPEELWVGSSRSGQSRKNSYLRARSWCSNLQRVQIVLALLMQ